MPKRKYENFIYFRFESYYLSVMIFVTTVVFFLFPNIQLVLMIYTA